MSGRSQKSARKAGKAERIDQKSRNIAAKPSEVPVDAASPMASTAPGFVTHDMPAGQGKPLSAVLGEVVWLLSQSPIHKQFFISDLEWFVMAPILAQQFRMFYAKDKPFGVLFWASVSPEVEQRLIQGGAKLQPQDWKSGDKLWVVEVVAPFGGAEQMLQDFKTKIGPDRKVNYAIIGRDGTREVKAA